MKEDGATGFRAYINRTLDRDLHDVVKDSEYVSQIHGNAEKFDPRAEEVFKYIQVRGAAGASFEGIFGSRSSTLVPPFLPCRNLLRKFVSTPQVLTAICDSFGHGANDVANAMGPFAAIYTTYIDGAVVDDSELGGNGFWILAIGGAGIVVGLMTYGYKIITAIGVKIAKITPSRGFSIELGAAIMIIIGSRLSMPLSTTHCQVSGNLHGIFITRVI